MKSRNHNRKIRILLVDDHPVVLSGVRDALSPQRDIEVVGEANTGEQALRKAKALVPDVVLMDISLPTMTGIETTRKLREKFPTIKVIAFTMHDNKEYVLDFIRQGGKGYVLKNSTPDELVRAIDVVYKGEKFFSPVISKLLVEQYVSHVASGKSEGELTSREKEVLAMIAAGMSSKQIGGQLNVSTRTVDTHREKIMKKLNIHTAVNLARYAISKGIVKA